MIFLSWISQIFNFFRQFFTSPIQKKPTCFLLPQLRKQGPLLKETDTNYSKFTQEILSLIQESRVRMRREERLRAYTGFMEKCATKYPKWDRKCIEFLNTLFTLYDSEGAGYMHRDEFLAILENLGDSTPAEVRKQVLNLLINERETIRIEEFFELIHSMFSSKDSEDDNMIETVKKLSVIVHNANKLSMEEQLEYGLC